MGSFLVPCYVILDEALNILNINGFNAYIMILYLILFIFFLVFSMQYLMVMFRQLEVEVGALSTFD